MRTGSSESAPLAGSTLLSSVEESASERILKSSGVIVAAAAAGVPYAGGVSPQAAWQLFTSGRARLVDVRSGEERKFVGHVPVALTKT